MRLLRGQELCGLAKALGRCLLFQGLAKVLFSGRLAFALVSVHFEIVRRLALGCVHMTTLWPLNPSTWERRCSRIKFVLNIGSLHF